MASLRPNIPMPWPGSSASTPARPSPRASKSARTPPRRAWPTTRKPRRCCSTSAESTSVGPALPGSPPLRRFDFVTLHHRPRQVPSAGPHELTAWRPADTREQPLIAPPSPHLCARGARRQKPLALAHPDRYPARDGEVAEWPKARPC